MAEEKQVVPVGIATESTEIAEQEAAPAVIPLLGLVVSLENPPEVAKALSAVREAKQQLDAVRSVLERVLVEEAARVGTKTLHLGDVEALVTGGPSVEYDIEELQKLQDAGLPEERFNALVKTEVTYKVDRRVIAQLLGAGNADYVRIIGQAAQDVERPYRVSVK